MPDRLFRNLRGSFQPHALSDVLRAVIEPRKPRNPLLRVVFGVLGLALLAVLLVLGVFIGAAMLAVGLVMRLWKQRGKPMAAPGPDARGRRVVDAEYRVVSKPVLPVPR